MLNLEIDDINGLAILTPDGPLSAEDFVHVASVIDPYIEADGRLNGLIIATKSFPGWDSFAALLSSAFSSLISFFTPISRSLFFSFLAFLASYSLRFVSPLPFFLDEAALPGNH